MTGFSRNDWSVSKWLVPLHIPTPMCRSPHCFTYWWAGGIFPFTLWGTVMVLLRTAALKMFSPRSLLTFWLTNATTIIMKRDNGLQFTKQLPCSVLIDLHAFSHITLLWTECLVSSRSLYVGSLAPNVMILGYGAFGRWLGLDEVLQVESPWLD